MAPAGSLAKPGMVIYRIIIIEWSLTRQSPMIDRLLPPGRDPNIGSMIPALRACATDAVRSCEQYVFVNSQFVR